MIIGNSSRLVMIGDSVTDCGRARPVGEGNDIGNGYVSYVKSLIESTYPEKKIRVINTGISGNTVRDLKNRWETDVLSLNPEWLSIMVGINDVWRQYDAPLVTEIHVYLEEYKETLEGLVKSTLPKLKGMILMAPFYMEPNKNDAMRMSMDKYSQVVKEIAEKYGTVFVDTQAAFDKLLEHFNSNNIAHDRVHPNITGHMVIARAFLKAIEYSFSEN